MTDRDDAMGRLAIERGLVSRGDFMTARSAHPDEPTHRLLLALGVTDADLAALEEETRSAQAATMINSAPVPRAEPKPAARVGKYTLMEKLGKGGMGVVYKAFDPDRNAHVAIKCMIASDDATDVKRFLREASTATALSHPNICAVYDIDEHEGTPYIVMEFISGQPFSRHLNPRSSAGQRMPVRSALAVVRDVARALHYAHGRGIVHRDIKPENVMVDDAGAPHLMDFGLAREIQHGATLTTTGHVLGTPYYMSPEQASGRRDLIDRRVDIWALGIMLYEIAARRLPIVAETPAEVLHRIVHEDLPAPRRIDTNIPRPLETIILKCLEYEPERRYATAGALADDLDRYLDGRPVTARPASLVVRLRRRLRRRKGLVVAAAVGLVAVVTLAAFLVPKLGSAQRAADDSRRAALAQLRRTSETALSAALGFRRMGRLRDMGQYLRQTEEACRKAVADLPGEAEPHYLLGRMYRAQMKFDDALREQEAGLRLSPDEPGCRYERALLLLRQYESTMEQRRLAWLRKMGERLFAQGGGRVNASVELREPKREEIEDEKARELREAAGRDFRFASEHSARLPEGQGACGMGLYAVVEGRVEEARRLLEDVVRKAPDLEEAWQALGHLARSAGDIEAAVSWFSRGLEQDQGYVPHLVSRAQTWEQDAKVKYYTGKKSGDSYAAAIADYGKALELDPGLVLVYHKRGSARLNCGLTRTQEGGDGRPLVEASIEDFERALESSSDRVEIWISRGLAYSNLAVDMRDAADGPAGHFGKSIDDFTRAIEQAPAKDEAWRGRGNARFNWGTYEQREGRDPGELYGGALEDLGRSLKLEPTHEGSWINRGLLHLNWGFHKQSRGANPSEDYAQAVEDFTQALKLTPWQDQPRAMRGDVRMKWAVYREGAGEDPGELYARALEDFEHVVTVSPLVEPSLRAMMNRCKAYLKSRKDR